MIVLTFSSESEREKFEYIYEKYKTLLLHKAYGILRDYMLAEDAVNEAMIRIYRNLDKIEDPDSGRAAAFVVTIVKNAALTILQKEKAYSFDPLEELYEDSFNLESHIVAQISADKIYQTVDMLEEDAKNVFLLKYSYGLSHREIGEALGLTENNVTVKLHRAKKKLAELLLKGGIAGER